MCACARFEPAGVAAGAPSGKRRGVRRETGVTPRLSEARPLEPTRVLNQPLPLTPLLLAPSASSWRHGGPLGRHRRGPGGARRPELPVLKTTWSSTTTPPADPRRGFPGVRVIEKRRPGALGSATPASRWPRGLPSLSWTTTPGPSRTGPAGHGGRNDDASVMAGRRLLSRVADRRPDHRPLEPDLAWSAAPDLASDRARRRAQPVGRQHVGAAVLFEEIGGSDEDAGRVGLPARAPRTTESASGSPSGGRGAGWSSTRRGGHRLLPWSARCLSYLRSRPHAEGVSKAG